jgi:hypothetical protein
VQSTRIPFSSPLPPNATFSSPRPSAMSSRSTKLPRGGSGVSPRPLTISTQTLLLPWHNKNSQITMNSAESNIGHIKVLSDWVKPQYQPKRAAGPQELEKELPLPPLPISRGSSLKVKVLHRSHSTTASKDEKGDHMTNDNDEESAAAEQAVFGQSGRKQVHVVQRISGVSVDSLVVEKLEVSQM